MISELPTDSPRVLAFKLTGKLHDADYETFIPAIDGGIATALASGGPARLLALFEDFHGWTIAAAWDDTKFGLKHYADLERIALVGDKTWEAWMATVCTPFTAASVKYFDTADTPAAWAWVQEGLAAPAVH